MPMSPGQNQERNFGFTLGLVLLILALYPLRHSLSWDSVRIPFLIASALLLALGQLRPSLLRPLNFVWMKFAMYLERFMNPLIMGVLFFAILTPYTLLLRLSGKRFLPLDREPGSSSYWKNRREAVQKETFSRQF